MEKKRAEVMGSLSLLVVAIIWGSGFIASQMALDAQMIDPMVYPDDQGFLTSEGAFVGRRDAARIAVAAGQVAAPKWGPDLFSEDLW